MGLRRAVCPGSFDPITHGHLDIIRRAAGLFDELIVLVIQNKDKKCMFSLEERADMIQRVVKDIPNVKVDVGDGLLVDYLREHDASVIVKGLRAMSDFEYEFQMALTNRQLYEKAETVFLTTSIERMYLSSSIVKQIASFGGDISTLVPAEIIDEVMEKAEKENEK
ncbi:MAG: pantetheine-phosphate adenylyltransferase [Clostridia bacterium]|nr:pantetheine-phosphate adenylyltransferase [Clostridia bacterium]